MTAYIVERDRADALRLVGERTSSMSRMIVAHGDAAADSALQIINSVYPVVAAWDLEETDTGRTIAARITEMASSNGIISAAWVLDAAGTNLVDSWGYPAKPVSAAQRPYFKAHLAGAPDPVIMGDEQPGSVTGKERFTISRAVRQPDGSLKAVIAVGIYKNIFDTLYKEAVNWPGARAGLYTVSGDVLARIQTADRATPAFVTELTRRAMERVSGTELVSVEPIPRIVSWRRSQAHPELFATSSQPVKVALGEWEARAWVTALLALAANGVFWILAWFAARSAQARQEAQANELAVREVNHRVKNSLQLISSLLQLKARKSDDTSYTEAVREVTAQLTALAETYRFVQGASKLGTVDAALTIEGLCNHLGETYQVPIALEAVSSIVVSANHATALTVIVNELVTNAIKHGGGPVTVSLKQDKEMLWLSFLSTKGRLPEGFSLEEAKGFGLRAVRSMLSGLGGHITAKNLVKEGTAFTVSIPVAALQKA
ncbi:sensor histidine kinase [Aestuariivirga sp.]|uniref:sensor histidine kinase n=1 Tax=Aestuariivirga sp. TaxID=2650926 RepID=UPI00391B6C45